MSGLRVQNFNAGYGPLHVVHDLSLEISPGERIGLVGLNGHGKTTFLRGLMGLAGWQSGNATVAETNLLQLKTHHIVRQGVVLMSQGDALFPGMSVRENLDAGAFSRASWQKRQERRDRVLHLFPALTKLLKQPAGTLSGGERRMLSLGRGLMSEARLLLVDEPSLGLAPAISLAVVDALFSSDFGNTTLLIAEQNRSLIEHRVQRLYVMHGGRLTHV
jgi:branched-chain amino acid transport system ATP-binding protein